MQAIQIIIGFIVILGLVFWTSATIEDKRWRPFHQIICQYLREHLPSDFPIKILEEFEKRIWSGRKIDGNQVMLYGELPLSIYLDTSLEDIRTLEKKVSLLQYDLEQKYNITLGTITLSIKKIIPEFFKDQQQNEKIAPPESEDQTIPLGEFNIDITDKTLRRFIAWHILLWQNIAPADLKDEGKVAERIFHRIRLQFIHDKRHIIIRHKSENDSQLAAYLEGRIQQIFGSKWEVTLHT